MRVSRRSILSVAWLIVCAAASAALVKLAFFPAPASTSDSSAPTGTVTQPLVAVKMGTILNTDTLKGSVAPDPAIAIKAPVNGTVDSIKIRQNQSVKAGSLLFSIRVEDDPDPEVEPSPTATSSPRPNSSSAPAAPVATYRSVYSSVTGIISAFSLIQGEPVEIGAVTAEIAPQRYMITGSVNPVNLYRLSPRPKAGTAIVSAGPRPFNCTDFTINTPLAGASQEGSSGDSTGNSTSASGTGTTFRCAVPAAVKVFTGLPASVSIASGDARKVLVAPLTAVRGRADDGVVYVQTKDGATVTRSVKLGLSDGENVEIKSGVKAGTEIREFVPDSSTSASLSRGLITTAD